MRSVVENLEYWPCCGRDNCIHIFQYKQEDGQEDEARPEADSDARNHDLGPSDRRLLNFFDHMRNSVEPCQPEPSLEESQQPGQPVRPARLVYEVAEDEVTGLESWGSASQDCNTNDSKSRDRPNECCLVNDREKRREKSIDQERKEVIADVDEKLMPALRIIRWTHKGDNPYNQLRPQEATSGSQRDPASSIDPADDP